MATIEKPITSKVEQILKHVKEGRDLKEVVSDHLLLLYMIKKYHEYSHRYFGITKLQKFTFLSENSMNKNKKKGLNYNFFRYTYGPMSRQIYADIELFKELKLVSKSDDIKLTERGEMILEEFSELFERNKTITEEIDKNIRLLANMDTESVKKFVYKLEKNVYSNKMKIEEIPIFINILSKISDEQAKNIFDIKDSDIETFNILLDDVTYNNILEIISEKSKSVPYTGIS